MQWKGRRESENVDDARGRTTAGVGGGNSLGLGLLTLIGRKFGIKGILIAAVIGIAAWKLGILDANLLLGDGASYTSQTSAAGPEDQERFDFVKVVLADTEDVWTSEFQRIGRQYRLPAMTVYRGRVDTACGTGTADMGPFYCPGDQKIYIDVGFYDELAQTFQSPGDFAQAYVIAHEVGHHVQNLFGDLTRQPAAGETENELSIRVELQADCYAGIWAAYTATLRDENGQPVLEPGDIEEALNAAAQIGDDAIQRRTQGYIVPETFNHGTSAQRQRWFQAGYQGRTIQSCNTFSARTL